ncbi:helix-turn-helix transcriptional regulator [Acuticoccus sediminis]|uniref:helix-turn-helix transcriptional regulator n=1 Tax=Acuticoccus sediminis TaxID=2184697 RepID=UPI001CFDF716|nr:AlpA family transcriptional regulator [Acuticoccus sediminis]
MDAPDRRLVRMKEVISRTGLPRRSLYDLISSGRFPRPVKISGRCVAWPMAEVDAWIESRIAERDAAAGGRSGRAR